MHKIKSNKKNGQKIVLIALVVVLITAAALIPFFIRTSIAYASTGTPATFLRTRSGTISDPGSDRAFAAYDFQRNESNFNHIEAAEIADLVDNRHDVDLRTQSNAIKQTAYITNVPVLTVITHSQAGDAGNWSNDGSSGALAYQSNSIIEMLRRQSEANVYVVRSNIFNVPQNVNYRGDNFENLNTETSGERPLIDLFPLELNNYSRVQESLNNGTANPEPRRTNLRDYYRHNILVFESRDSLQYRNFVYNELNAILTMISYDYLQATGAIPLINMISHSTGGAWNMMWANRHPHNVHSIFTIAAPFGGSNTGTAIRNDWLSLYSLPHDMINNPSSFDNTDTEQRDLLMTGWQSAVNQNPNIRLFTMAGETCWYLLANAPPWWGTAIFSIMLAPILANPAPVIDNLPLMAILCPLAGPALSYYLLSNTRSEWFTEGAIRRLVLSDDVLVSKSSASADGFYNPNNNINRWTKVYGNHNVNAGLAQPDTEAVPHNYAPRDLDTLNHIVSNITMGTVLKTTLNGNNVTINYANATLNGNLELPEQVFIGGQYRNVTAIGLSAFSGCTGLTGITIPANVTSIGNQAFADCSGLVSITVLSGNSIYKSDGNCLIETSTNTLVAGCKNSVIPDYITNIGEYAFEGSGITGIYIPASVTYIKSNAFYGTNLYIVRLNVTYGTGGSSYVVVANGSAMPPATAPTREGFTFAGYYSSGNVQYYSANMTSIRDYFYGTDVLYARWTADNTLIISYSGGGGTGSPPSSPASAMNDEYITMPQNTYTRPGYTFAGWEVSGTGSISGTHNAGTTIAVTSLSTAINNSDASIVLTATWTANTLTISYSGGGGTGSSPSSPASVSYDYYITMPQNTYTRAGYTFAGWEVSGTGSISGTYNAGTTIAVTSLSTAINNSDANIVLTATWTANTLTISYSGGGGTGSSPSSPASVSYDYYITMPQNTYTRAGYTFAGWEVSGTGSISGTYNAGTTIAVTSLSTAINNGDANIVLTAMWTAVASNYTVAFDTQGGSSIPSITNVTSGSKISMPSSTPTRSGYTFGGWYKESACQNAWNFAIDTVTANVTLYTKWTPWDLADYNVYEVYDYLINGDDLPLLFVAVSPNGGIYIINASLQYSYIISIYALGTSGLELSYELYDYNGSINDTIILEEGVYYFFEINCYGDYGFAVVELILIWWC